MTHHSPLSQFEIKTFIPFSVQGIDLSYTNSSFFMTIAVVLIGGFLAIAMRKPSLVPSRLQSSAEMLYGMIEGMIKQNVGADGKPFLPLIFTTFMFILLCNLLGMVPYSFTTTSHIIITFGLAMIIFLLVTI